jgi:hypothetical protein
MLDPNGRSFKNYGTQQNSCQINLPGREYMLYEKSLIKQGT